MTNHVGPADPAGLTAGRSRWRSIIALIAALTMTASLATIAPPSAQSSQAPVHPLSCTETQRIDTVPSPGDVVFGDFNGNGKPGFATGGIDLGDFVGAVAVHRRADDGSFLEPDIYTLPNKNGEQFAFRIPRALVATDLTGNGVADIAGAQGRTDEVTVMSNTGDGTDFDITHYPTGDGESPSDRSLHPDNRDLTGKQNLAGAEPEDLVVVDVTGNGAPDLVTANSDSDDVSVLANGVGRAGVGVFALAGTYPVHDADTAFGISYGPRQITAGDFDKDSAPDLAIRIGNVTNRPARRPSTPLYEHSPPEARDTFIDDQAQHIRVLSNLGTGAFTPSTKVRVPGMTSGLPNAVVAADITGDGHTDLGAAGSHYRAYLFPGQGDGTFGSPVVQHIAGRMLNGSARALRTIDAVDVTGDGSQELVFGSTSQDLTTLVDTDQGFAEPMYTPKGSGGTGQGIATVKNDDELLVATANLSEWTVSVVAQGDDDCVFKPPAERYELSGVARAPGAVAMGDLTGNGDMDLATANADSSDVSVLEGDGQGNFTEQANSPYDVEGDTSSSPADIAIADLTGDGIGEIITANADTDRVSVLEHDASGVFAAHADSPHPVGTTPTGVAVADVTGDGELDVVTANKGSDDVSVLAGDGSGSLSPTSASPHAVGTDPVDVAVDELTGDGALDVATANKASDDLSLLANDGSGGFTATGGSPLAVGSDPVAVVAAELTGDTNLDLAAANEGSNDVSVLASDGSGGFTETSDSPTPASNTDRSHELDGLEATEATGDGNQDLIVITRSRHVGVLPGDGAGGFGRPREHKIREAPRSLAVGDVNGDGRPDAVAGNFDGGRLNLVSVLLHRGPQT